MSAEVLQDAEVVYRAYTSLVHDDVYFICFAQFISFLDWCILFGMVYLSSIFWLDWPLFIGLVIIHCPTNTFHMDIVNATCILCEGPYFSCFLYRWCFIGLGFEPHHFHSGSSWSRVWFPLPTVSLACVTGPHKWSIRWHHRQKNFIRAKSLSTWVASLMMWGVGRYLHNVTQV